MSRQYYTASDILDKIESAAVKGLSLDLSPEEVQKLYQLLQELA